MADFNLIYFDEVFFFSRFKFHRIQLHVDDGS